MVTEWILQPADDRDSSDDPDPWSPWYDKCFGMIVRAETEGEARQVAQDHAKDETRISSVHHDVETSITDREVWTDPDLAECIPLSEYEPEREGEYADDNRLLMQDVSHA